MPCFACDGYSVWDYDAKSICTIQGRYNYIARGNKKHICGEIVIVEMSYFAAIFEIVI